MIFNNNIFLKTIKKKKPETNRNKYIKSVYKKIKSIVKIKNFI